MANKVTGLDAIKLQHLTANIWVDVVWQSAEQLGDSCHCLFAVVEFEPVGITTVLAQRAVPEAQLAAHCRVDIFALNFPGLALFGAQYKAAAIGLAWGKRSTAHLVPVPCLSCNVLTLQRLGTIGLDRRISWEHNYIHALQMVGKAA